MTILLKLLRDIYGANHIFIWKEENVSTGHANAARNWLFRALTGIIILDAISFHFFYSSWIVAMTTQMDVWRECAGITLWSCIKQGIQRTTFLHHWAIRAVQNAYHDVISYIALPHQNGCGFITNCCNLVTVNCSMKCIY